MEDPHHITQLLGRFRAGDREAFDELLPAVYDDLHDIASRQLAAGGSGPSAAKTLSPTVLVHEAYLRLSASQSPPQLEDRPHFYCVAARAMRNVLVDHARARVAQKRGGRQPLATLDTSMHAAEAKSEDVLRLNDALERLREKDVLLYQIVELRFFGGLGQAEIAKVIGKSERTVKREWAVARAWLARELKAQD